MSLPHDVVKVEILVNQEPVDTLACLVHRDKGRARAIKVPRRPTCAAP